MIEDYLDELCPCQKLDTSRNTSDGSLLIIHCRQVQAPTRGHFIEILKLLDNFCLSQ